MSNLIEMEEFFAPSNEDRIDVLLSHYEVEKQQIEAVAQFMHQDAMQQALHHFVEGNKSLYQRHTPDPAKMFPIESAMAHLNARFWQQALSLTDVYDFMPHTRRKEWGRQIREMDTPPFDEDHVRPTIASLLSQRMDFLAEKVDGIFQNLSKAHVTNQPEGFYIRMIIGNAWSSAESKIGGNGGYLHDLRSVCARFMGRDEPYMASTSDAFKVAGKQHGEWLHIDGNAIKMRVYLKGTCHIQVHPDMAWRLNQVLAHLYPSAIPEKNRKRRAERKVLKDVPLSSNLIPWNVLELLSDSYYENGSNARGTNATLQLRTYGKDKHTVKAAKDILAAIGGVEASYPSEFEFDYHAQPIIEEIISSGQIPDRYTHQYYPTPKPLASHIVELAEIKPDDHCCEPSAGQGHIAKLLPKDRTTCIEVNDLHASILEAKGFRTVNKDFLKVSMSDPEVPEGGFQVIAMNPPFSEGRARAHVDHACSLLAPGGRLVAVVPISAMNQWQFNESPHLSVNWQGAFDRQFEGTEVSVTVVVITNTVQAARRAA